MPDTGLTSERQLARRILQLIDLTSLNLDDTDSTICRLCEQAVTALAPRPRSVSILPLSLPPNRR